jgi:hypothetical protein
VWPGANKDSQEKGSTEDLGARSARDSWGGRALVILGWSIVAGAVVSKLIDGTTRTQDSTGVVEYVSNGNVGKLLGLAVFLVATACAGVAVLAPKGRRAALHFFAFTGLFYLALAWWILTSIILRRDAVDVQQTPFIMCVAVIILGVIVSPPTLRTVRSFNTIRDVSAVLTLVVSALDPIGSQMPCRADKCGIFNSLYVGFFFTENAAAMFIMLLLPTLIVVTSPRRLTLSLSVSAVALLATGSRTSLIDFAVVTIYVLWYRRSVLSGQDRRVGFIWRMVPALAFTLSCTAFLLYSGDELTGRGWIYAGIRSQLKGYALLVGSGPSTMDRLFQSRSVAFEAVGEHGLVPHILVQAGIVGLILVAAGLLALVLDPNRWSPRHIASFGLLLAASLQSVTEPGWMLSARTMNFASMLLALGLFTRESSAANTPFRPQSTTHAPETPAPKSGDAEKGNRVRSTARTGHAAAVPSSEFGTGT